MTPRFAITLLLLVLLGVAPSIAQETSLERAWPSLESQPSKSDSKPARIHVTDDLLRSPEGKAALREYVEARKAGFLGAGKQSAMADTIGQERDFNVQQNLLVDSLHEWTTVTFTLRSTNDVANVWVETSLDGTFSSENMEELEAYILSATPDDSYRPDQGIIANNNDTFGAPPNVDGDGRVDILLHEILEGEGAGCCILGYVTSADLNSSSNGNDADVLYIDLPDGIRNGGVNRIAGTIAHEYQHLIHFEYMHSPELTFVNEGMSEWAEVVNGFFLRTIDYLQNTEEHNTSLFAFRDAASIDVRDVDYQRSGLFTTYLADRIGRVRTGEIVRATEPTSSIYAVGAQGYEVVLQKEGLTLEDVVADFHTANYVNSVDVDARFGYALPQRQSLSITPTTTIDGAAEQSASSDVSVQGGAVRYIRWSSVANLDLNVVAPLSNGGDSRQQTRFRLFLEPIQGPAIVEDLPSSVTGHVVEGDYSAVTLLVINDDVSSSEPVEFTISSEWNPVGGEWAEHTLSYENGESAGQPYFTLSSTTRLASHFEVPNSGRLSTVYVAPVYTNQFIGEDNEPLLPDGLPRDFNLHVWADDGSGHPGEELFSKKVVGDPSFNHLNFGSLEFSFLEVPLPEDDPALTDLPPTIYIGISNAGSDENILVLATASLIGAEDRSLILLGDSWRQFSEVVSETQEPLLEGRVLPIRAQFLVATADEDPHELPSTASLAQNYPNPFNPVTSIEYELPRAEHVRLAVFDVLGRQVATVVDEVRQAGPHTSVVNASGWSSGVYFYTLQTEGRTLTRQMIVLK